MLKVPGLDTPGGVRADRRRADHRPGAHLRPPPAGRRDQRAHRPAPADLGRARLERQHAGEHRAADPPGANFREGERYIVALRKLRDATGARSRAERAFRLYRDRRQDRLAARSSAAARTWSASSGALRRAGDRAARPLPGLGLHRRERALAVAAAAVDPRPRVRRAGRPRPRRPEGRRARAPKFTIDRIIDSTPAEKPNVRRRVEGHVTVPCYLDQPGCPPGLALPPRARRPAGAHRRATPTRRRSSATSRARPRRPRRPARRSTDTACSAAPARSAPTTSSSSATRTTCSCARADWIGMAERTSPTPLAILQDLSRFPSLADRLQQGFLDFLFLGRAMIHPTGLRREPGVPGRRRPADRHAPALLLRQQPGRHRRRRADRAWRPTSTARCSSCGAMNYSLLLTRSVDFDPFAAVLYPAYPDELERPLMLSLIQIALGPRRPERLRLAHDHDPTPNTPRHKVLLHPVLRRPPGGQRRHRGRGAHDRLAPAPARARPGPQHRRAPYYGIPPIRSFPYAGDARWWSGTSGRCAARVRRAGTECLGTPPPPITNTAAAARRRSARPRDRVARRARSASSPSSCASTARSSTCAAGCPCHAAGWTGP